MPALLRLSLLLLIIGWGPEILPAQQACMEVGTNFFNFGPGVRKDLKISSSQFLTRNTTFVGDGNDWDSGLGATMPQDAAGYPLQVPFPHPTTTHDQMVAFTVGGHSGNYAAGNYVLLHDGEGTFDIPSWIAATITNVSPGRVEFTVDTVNVNGIHMQITSSTAGNHLRNIRIVQDIYEHNYQSDPFLPEFQSKAEHFTAFRFMDWSHTNGNTTMTWSDRTRPEHHTQESWVREMSWERMIETANYFQKDVWINVPHMADTTYIDSLAYLFRDLLDPSLSITVEYTNEGWNWIFPQTFWLDSVGPYPGSNGRNYGYYANRVFTRWEGIFAGQESRLKMVLAGHDYFVLNALDYTDSVGTTHLVDQVSYPGYVALNPNDYDTLETYGANATPQMVIDLLNANKADSYYWMWQFKNLIVDVYNKEFVMYEGGQHVTPEIWGVMTDYVPALYAAQTHPGMGDFYTDLMNYFQDSLGVTQFMNFVLAAPQESLFGSWGLLDNYFIGAPYAPKYNAVIDFIQANNCSPTTDIEDIAPRLISVYPNPNRGQFRIQGWEQFERAEIRIWDLQGVVVYQGPASEQIDLGHISPGMYFLHLSDQQRSSTSKFIVH